LVIFFRHQEYCGDRCVIVCNTKQFRKNLYLQGSFVVICGTERGRQKSTLGKVSADAEYHLKVIQVESSFEETVRAAINSANSHKNLDCVLGKEEG